MAFLLYVLSVYIVMLSRLPTQYYSASIYSNCYTPSFYGFTVDARLQVSVAVAFNALYCMERILSTDEPTSVYECVVCVEYLFSVLPSSMHSMLDGHP